MAFGRAVIILCIINGIHAARILAVFPIFLKSHSIFTHTIARELALRGHDVTIITPFEDKDPPPNYKQVISDKKSCWDGDFSETETDQFIKADLPFLIEEYERWSSLHWFTEAGLNSSQVSKFIKNDNSNYDAVLIEVFFQEAYLMFAHKYKAPVIMLSSFGAGQTINQQMGNPLLLSSVPYEFLDNFGPLDLWQRIKNIIWTIIDLNGRRIFHLPAQQNLAEKYFEHLPKPLPQLTDLERNVSLILVNTHFSIDTIRPNVPGIVEVGGIHIKPTQKLPDDLRKFCDEASDGLIYYSLGTILKGSRIPKWRIDEFVRAFSKIKQRVLWKWDGDERPKVSDNVRFFDWAPQAEILNHPNTKIFITHGGLLGIQEAIYYGVPIIGMPFFGDQPFNVDRAVKHGYGVRLLFRDATEARLKDAIGKIINDSKYGERARELSRLFRDKPEGPLDTAMFWIEYVVRNKGAYHMRSPVLDLKWYEYLLIDVVVILLTTTIVIAATITFCTYIICKLLLFRKKHKKTKKH